MIGDPFQILLVLGVIAVILLWGPQKIPELARSLGKARKTFDDASRGIEEVDLSKVHDPVINAAHAAGLDTKGKTKQQVESELREAAHATPPASTTVQPDIISSYLFIGPSGTYTPTYNAMGQMTSLTYGNLTVTYTYNSDGSISTATYTVGTVSATDAITYDGTGSIASVTRS